jgi:hypothetical protein
MLMCRIPQHWEKEATTMNKRILYAGLPIAALFCGGANAQSLYTDPDILELTPSQQTTVYRTIVRETVVPQTQTFVRETVVPQRRTVVRETARRPIVAQTEPRVTRRTVQRERVVARPAVTRERIVTRTVAPAATTSFVTADPIDLAPAQRTVVYRTLVQQRVAPAPLVTERILPSPVARPFVTTEPVVTAPAYAPVTTGTAIVTDAPGGYVPATEIAIGARIPASVPLYAMPAETIAVAPTLAGYRYALVGGRVYLVDPSDGIVSAMLYQ